MATDPAFAGFKLVTPAKAEDGYSGFKKVAAPAAEDPYAGFNRVQAETPAVEPDSPMGAFARAFGLEIGPSVATGLGGAGSAILATPSGPVGMAAADIAGGMAAGTAARALQNTILGDETVAAMEAQMAANAAAHPISTGAGAFIGQIPAFLGGGPIKPKQIGDLAAKLTRTEHVVNATVVGARLGGSVGAQDLVTGRAGAEVDTIPEGALHILDNMAKSAVGLGVTGLIPGARSLLGSVLKKAPSDAAAMVVATALYDKAVHGKDIDPEAMLKETGSHLPGFMLLNLVGHGSAMMRPLRAKLDGEAYVRDSSGVWNRRVVPSKVGDPLLEPLNPFGRDAQIIEGLEAKHQAFLKTPEGEKWLAEQLLPGAPKPEETPVATTEGAVKPVTDPAPEAPAAEAKSDIKPVTKDFDWTQPDALKTRTAEYETAGMKPDEALAKSREELDVAATAAVQSAKERAVKPPEEVKVEPVEPAAAEPPPPETAVTTPPEPVKPAEQAPGAVGEPGKGPTSIKNEIVDKERAERGLPPLVQPAKREFGTVWDEAMKKADADPRAGSKLVDELVEKPRPLTDSENALLLHEQISRRAAVDRARDEVNNSTEATRAEKVEALDRANEDYDRINQATKKSGTENARGLNSRKMMANEDLSLTNMEARVRAEVNEGKPLTPNQAAWVAKLHKELKDQKQVTDEIDQRLLGDTVQHYIDMEVKSLKAERDAALAEVEKAKTAAPKPAKTKEPKPEVLAKLVERLSKAEEEAWKNIRKDMGQTNATVFLFNPARLGDYATIVASWTAKGIKGAADLTKKIVETFGESFKAHADEIIAASKAKYDAEVIGVTKKDQRSTLDQVVKNAQEGKAPVPRLVRELVREQVIAGKTNHKEIMTEVQKILEPHHPGITERQVSDIYSGYGKVAFPSKESVDVKMRELRRLRQLASAVEDAMAKRASMKSGAQRDKATQEIRDMQKELTRVMRENGIEQSTAEQQLKTSLDGVKTRLRNAIEDLETQIATGRKTPRKPGVDYDAEAKALKAEVDRLREIVTTMEGPKVKTFDERLAEATKSVEKQIAELERKIKDKDFVKGASEIVVTHELQVMRDARDALRDHFNQLKVEALGKKELTEDQRTDIAVKATKRAIEDLERRIKEKDFSTADKPVLETPELRGLREQRDALRDQYNELKEATVGRKELTPEKRIELATKALEKSLADLEARVKVGDITPRPKGSKTPETAQLQVMRDRRNAMRKELKLMKVLSESPAVDPAPAQLARDVKAIEARTRKLQERIAKGDFAPPVKPQKGMETERLDAQFKYDQARKEFTRGVFEAKLAARSPAKKILDTGMEILNTSRAILTSVDLSAVLRQGGFLVIGHPVKSAKSLVPMFKAFASEKAAFEVEQQILNRPNAKNGMYERAKLDITKSDEASLTKMEEAYMSRWVGKIPKAMGGGLIRGSERAYRTFLNKLRADSFDTMLESLRRGPEPTLAEAQALAKFINTATGRGDLGKMNQAAVALNTVFFAPKLVASRFQLLAGAPMWQGTSRTRALVAKEYARFLLGVGLIYGLGSMFQDDKDPPISLDPRGSEFGKLRYGNTRVDPLAGLAQVTVLLGRMATGEKVNSKGKVTPIRGADVPYGSDDVFDVMSNFARSKFSPAFGAVVNMFAGKNVVGQPTDVGTEAARMVIPMSVDQIVKAMEEHGATEGTALSILSIFGMGVQTYDNTKKPEK